jgi:RNA-directed DNA polymerase
VCNVVSPHLERSMTPNSCANRIGMGTKKGLDLFGRFAYKYTYVLKCDVRQFFPSIDRDVLLDLLRPIVHDEHLLALIRQILFIAPASCHEFDYFPGDTLLSPCECVRGLPIGNMTSQTWANWYLSGLDHFIMDYLGYGAYVRYVDDFAVFADDKSALGLLKERIIEYLQRLRLRIHPEKSRVYRTSDGVPFLGFRHFRTHCVLNKSNIRRFRQRVRTMVRAGAGMERLRASIAGWAGFARMGDTAGLRNKLCSRFERLASGQGVTVPRFAWGLVEQQR